MRARRYRGAVAMGCVTVALIAVMPWTRPLFAAAFPALSRPLFTLDDFATLAGSHLALVAASSLAAAFAGIGIGVAVTRPLGRPFRGVAETIAAAMQTIPPVAVLAFAVPLIGFGAWPALLALAIYGVLPVLRGTLAGLGGVDPGALESAEGLGMSAATRLWRVELPLAAPVIWAGVRVSVAINIGTAAIASTVGARTLGTPIVIGLNGFNSAYVIQGAVVLAAMALTVDQAFEALAPRRS